MAPETAGTAASASATADSATYLRGVTFTYQSDPELPATECGVRDIDLDFPEGSCTLITGPSGSGKSTILKLLNGLIPELYPGELHGEVRLAGLSTTATPIQELGRAAGTVFQNPRAQFFTAKVLEELAFAGENAGDAPELIAERIAHAATTWNIERFLPRRLAQLSGGELQLVASAAALVGPHRILLFDEPTSNLSPEMVGHFAQVVRALKARGWTTIIAEHRLYPLRGVADRVVVMHGGRITGRYAAADFFAMDETERIGLGLRTLRVPERAARVSATAHKGDDAGTPASAPTTPGVVAEAVRFAYGPHEVLNLERVEIPAGQVTAVTGPNGAGKTTLARVLIGLAHPESGARISFGGKVCRGRERLRHSSLVMQDVTRQLFAETVRGEVALGNAGVSADRIEQVLADLGLGEVADRHPATLSGGQKQRLVVANATVAHADFYVFDEPTSGVDYRHLHSISTHIRALAARGATVLVISHDPEFINEVADNELHLEPRDPESGTQRAELFGLLK
ncbi:ABC transporter [Actinotignum timonense]|nr:ABC transporter ATP-binding protein [Actinotignum schaalii]PLB84674.1 ABC transporter [Actinotignum timonense]